MASFVTQRIEAASRALDARVSLKHVHRRLQAFAKVPLRVENSPVPCRYSFTEIAFPEMHDDHE